MKGIDAATLAGALGAEQVSGADGAWAGSVSTDTRTLARGAVYFALRGERFDGHDFLPQAIAGGAAALVVESWPAGLDAKGAAVLRVPDTLLALQRLAYWYRDTLDLPVIAITGSNGKTSTKEFTAAVLAQRFRVNATAGNLNNHIGLPLTVLATEASHTAAVWEMGMNHPGEIAPLCEIAKPKIGIITNIGTAHIEHLGSREGIAEEKGALARSLPEDGTLILPAGCDFVEYFRQRTRARVLCVGNGRGVIRAENISSTDIGTAFDLVGEGDARAHVQLQVVGRHMVTNALLAACAGHVLGLSLAEIAVGLAAAAPSGGRLRRFTSAGVRVFDDTYNANPDSMAAALETLAEHPVADGQQRIAVLGHMAELGSHAVEGHRRVGRLAAERGILVVAVGPLARDIAAAATEAHGSAEHFPDQTRAAEWLRAHCRIGDAVLFKGSRTAAIEQVMHQVFPEISPMLNAIYEWWAAALEEQTAAGIDGWANKFSFFNVLQYITVRAALAFLMAFFVSLAAGPWVIRKLISLKIGQPIRSAEEVHKLHELHGKKAGTPTMGGVLILGSVLLALLFCARLFNPFVAVTACTMTALGLLGFCDDYKKIREKNSAGINARAKLFWQITIALVAGSFMYFKTEISGFGATAEIVKQLGYAPGFHLGEEAMPVSAISFPLFKKPLFDMGILIIPFFALIIVGCSNAVNLTDGLDGLATGCTVSVGLAFAAIAYLAGHYWMAVEYLVIPHNRFVGELSVVLLALVGASFGFLWFNCHPAKMFMGDTGSLAIGGALGTAAICVKQELMLVIIGGVFVMEALSVILQVGSFKLRGKRIFAMSPIHHHFELRGWHESQVIIRFWILSVVLALIGVALLKVA